MSNFDKCDVARIHWLIYNDNNLVYYDERPIMERLNHSVFPSQWNKFHKSIVRGKDFKGVMFNGSMHQLLTETITQQCDAEGNIEKNGKGILTNPKYKYCHIRHYIYKTAEEFAMKILRGRHRKTKFKVEETVDGFFKLNTFTEEKLEVIERILKMKFPKFHKNSTIIKH